MPRAKTKKKKVVGAPRAEPADEPNPPQRAGMPAKKSIIGKDRMVRDGVVIDIYHTNEGDPYDKKRARRARKSGGENSSQ